MISAASRSLQSLVWIATPADHSIAPVDVVIAGARRGSAATCSHPREDVTDMAVTPEGIEEMPPGGRDTNRAARAAAAPLTVVVGTGASPLRSILDVLPDLVHIYDDQWRCVHINAPAAEWLRTLGLDPIHLLGRCVWDVLPAGRWPSVYEAAQRAVGERREVRHAASAGGRDFETRIIPQPGGIVCLTRDVTAAKRDIDRRKRAEDALALVMDAGRRLACCLDVDALLDLLLELALPRLGDCLIIDLIDDAASAVSETRVAHVVAEQQTVCEAHPRCRAHGTRSSDSPVWHAIRTQEPVVARVAAEYFTEHTADSDEADLLRTIGARALLIQPLVARGRALGAMTFCICESDRQHTDADLLLARELAARASVAVENARLHGVVQLRLEAAEAANLAKTQFLAVISHELRTPLTAVIGVTDLLGLEVWGPLLPDQKEQLDRIRSAAWHLVGIIDEILTFSRAEAGKESVLLGAVDLRRLVLDVATLLEPQATAQGVSLGVHVPDTEMVIRTDSGKVRQVLLNLIGNAIKFTDAGIVELTVARTGDAVVLEVRDTGIGIPTEYLQQVFEPFWQVDQSNTRPYGGAGLGLPVCQRLVRLLGGTISVESAPGRGSLFSVTLPITQ
jgi:signal transduction histidine kinase